MIQFRLFQLLVFILHLFPYSWRKAFFVGIAKLVYAVDRSRRRVIRQNIKFAFGDELDEEPIEAISRYAFKNMGLNLFQIIENHFCSREDIAKQVTYENKEVVDKALAEGRPIIFSSGHFGRWELAAVTISSQLAPSLIIYKTIKNRYFENYLIEARQRLGMTCVNSGGAVKAMVKQMRSKGAIAIMTDVNTSPRDGVKVDFFGHPTLHPRTPAYLASKFGAVIIPTFFYTDDDERFVMRFEEPIEAPKSGDEEADIIAMTQLQASQVEAAIRKRPELWFWPHRRWKSDYPEIYKS